MQAAVIKPAIDVTRLMEQLHQQKQAREEQYEYMEKKSVAIQLETPNKAPGRGEKLDTSG